MPKNALTFVDERGVVKSETQAWEFGFTRRIAGKLTLRYAISNILNSNTLIQW